MTRMGHKPKNNAEAIKSCEGCRRLVNKQCCLLGTITINTRDLCFNNGYADRNVGQHEEIIGFGGKYFRLPPCI